MGKVVYPVNVSLDGLVETADHSLDYYGLDNRSHTTSGRSHPC